MKKIEIQLSFDDGRMEDLGLYVLLCKYNLPTTFYIPTITKLPPEIIKCISERFEIGGHTLSHPEDLQRLDDSQLDREIASNKRWLEKITGKEITKFCYPSGRYNKRVIEAVKNAGFKEARTTLVLHTEFPENPFETHTTIHIRPDRKEYHGTNWLDVAKNYFDEVMAKGGRYELWGHSREIDLFGLWREFGELLEYISKFKRLGYA